MVATSPPASTPRLHLAEPYATKPMTTEARIAHPSGRPVHDLRHRYREDAVGERRAAPPARMARAGRVSPASKISK
jgi:hypothetical protein